MEKLYLSSNVFFHGEWGARKLNRIQLYCNNLEGIKEIPFELKVNLTNAIKDFFGMVVPEIERILSYARSTRLSHTNIKDVQTNMLELSRTLNQINVDVKIPHGVKKNTITAAVEQLELLKNSLKSLRDRVGAAFTCDVYSLLQESIKSNQKQSVDIELKTTGSKRIFARIRPVEFSQILDNILNNSIDAVQKANQKVIKVTLTANLDSVIIQVSDSGTGITPKIQKKLFKEQVTTKAGHKGFGLYYTKEVLDKYGGSIQLLESIPMKKTIFQIQLKRISNV
jgi:signal transduction histidine kinase